MLYKPCYACKEMKPVVEFCKHPAMADGYASSCKRCANEQVKASRLAKPLYTNHYNAKQRCNQEYSSQYHNYGGRGIQFHLGDTYEEFWRNVKDEFKRCQELFKDSKEPLTLERINVNGNYEKSNITFVPKSWQQRNRQDSVHITYRGRTECVGEWARLLGIHAGTIYARLGRGWDPVEALLLAPFEQRVDF